MADELVGTDVEWRDVTGYDHDGHLDRIEQGGCGPVLIVSGVRRRNWMDDLNRETGEHEVIKLTGERRVRMEYVVQIGPCSYPR